MSPDELELPDLAAAIEAVVEAVQSDEATEFAVAAGRAVLAADDEQW